MRFTSLFTFIALLSGLDVRCEGNSYRERSAERIIYPPARRDPCVVDDFNGTKVYDPYRWLEKPDSEETKAFVTAQNAISGPYFDACPVKEKIKEKLKQGKDYTRYYCPRHEGGKYYFFHNNRLQNQDVMYVQDTLDSAPSEFLNPNNFSKDGNVFLGYTGGFSKDGSYYAYSVFKGGARWVTIKVMTVADRQDLPDTLDFVRFSYLAWMPDNSGFFYSSYLMAANVSDGSNTVLTENHKLYYHRLGTNQSQDVLAFHDPLLRAVQIKGRPSDDGNYLIIYISTTTSNKLYVTDLLSLQDGVTGLLNPVKVIDNLDNLYSYIANVGQDFIFITNKDASDQRLIKVNIINPDIDNWVTLVGDNPEKGLLSRVVSVNNKLVLHYVLEGKSQLFVHNLQTGAMEHEVALDVGSIRCMTGKTSDTKMFFNIRTFLSPNIIYALDMESYHTSVFHESRVSGFIRENFEMHHLSYASKDGTMVPMFLVHKKNLQRSGNHPVLLNGFGAFGKSWEAKFYSNIIVFIQHLGGIYVVASIRGGSEYGEDWHKDGMLGNKQNGFDDFQAAAEYLIDNNYTNTDKLALLGESSGGLLVGACLNQKPELFAAGIIVKGVLDMLRFQHFTVGRYWIKEYGSSNNATQFQWLYRYSPLHNIPSDPKGGQYPATLILTADNDYQVLPLHSLKFAAELQHTHGNRTNQTNPLLLRVETNAVHGAGKLPSRTIEEKTDMFSFLYVALKLTWCDM